MKNRDRIGLAAVLLSAVLAGCGSGGGGEEGATDDQMKDPAWVQARIKELDKNPEIAKPKPSTKR